MNEDINKEESTENLFGNGPAIPTITPKKQKTRTERKFPALTFQQAIDLAESIQRVAGGQKVRRTTLFEALEKSPDSSTTRTLITSSGQYGLTKG